MHRSLKLSLLLAALLTAATPALAQQTLGGITGTVLDPSGGAIPGVQIKAVSDDTKLTRTATSNSQGSYQLGNLPIGTYTVTFSLTGFSTEKFPGILVQADRTATLPAKLAVGAVSDSVTVDFNPLLNAVDTTNGYVLDKAQIEAIPLPTGSFTGVAILSTGVNAELPGGTGANSGMGNAPIWANGQRDTSNSFMLNGVDASNLFNGKSTSQVASARVVNNTGGGNGGAGGVIQSNVSVYLSIGNAIPTPAPESLSEVKVNASMYDTSQGGASGAHIDVSTASGTNDIHGTAYFHRGTDWLNAAPFFFKQDPSIPANEKVPQLHRYTAGGTFGAPIIKDKLFGFVAFQHVHVSDQETGISRLTVPIGLSDDRSAAGLLALANNNFGSGATYASPVALFLLQHPALPGEPGKWLIPNDNGNTPSYDLPFNASIPGTSRFKADQAVADLDWNATARDTVSLKYYYQHDPAISPYGYSQIPGFAVHMDTGSQVASITNTLTLKSNLSTVQSFGFIREKVYGTNEQPFSAADAHITGNFGSDYFPGITILDAVSNYNSGVNPNGVYNFGFNIGPGPSAQGAYTGVFQNRFMPSVAAFWTLGKHTLSFGGSYAYTQLDARDERTNKGMIAVNDFGNFVQGNISFQNNAFTTTTFLLGDANRYYRAGQSGAFLQDKFQLLPNLSLTAGVRYDWNGGLSEKNGRIFNFDPSQYAYNATSGQVTSNGFIIAGNSPTGATPGVSDTTLTGRQWGIAPRLGLAWQPETFHGKVVVRAGAGFYYDRGELFSYLSPGYAAGEVTGGPFGVNQTPPFVNAIQCNPDGSVQDHQPSTGATTSSNCTGEISLTSPWGTTPGYQPSGKASDISNYLPSAAAIVGGAPLFSFANYERTNKLPYTINYTLDIQWQPRNDISLTLGYVGNLGRHQVIPIPFNQASVASPTNILHPGPYQQKYTYGYGLQSVGQTCSDGYFSCSPATLPDGTKYLANYEGGNIDLRVPYIGYSAESETYRAGGVSSYNAFTAHLEKRMSHGIQFGVSYTYSHVLDEQSGIGLFYNGNNPLNLRDGYASADFDRTHVINGSILYKIPAILEGHVVVSKFVNGWAIQGIGIVQSGQPYSIIDYSGAVGSIFYGVADGITNPIVPLDYSKCSPKTAKTGSNGAFVANGGAPALNAACFYVPLVAPGGLNGAIPGPSPDGTAPQGDTFETNFTHGQRNIFRQSYQKRADASLVKSFSLHERYKFQYTFDVFNLTNTASFDIPGDNVNQNGGFLPDPTAGQGLYNAPGGLGVTTHTIGSARQIQMSLRMLF